MPLPIFKSQDPVMEQDFMLMQTGWASAINPLLASPMLKGSFLKSVPLINGVTAINHLLGRTLQGWFVTDSNAAATIYRSQPKNNLTLTLTSNAVVTVDLYVF